MAARTLTRRLLASGGVALTSAALAVGPAAAAHASDCTKTSDGYSHHVIKVCGNKLHHNQVIPQVQSNSGSQLPFTGAEVTLMSVVGLGLVGGGTMLVVAGRRRRAAQPAA